MMKPINKINVIFCLDAPTHDIKSNMYSHKDDI